MIEETIRDYLMSRTSDLAWLMFKIIDGDLFMALHYGSYVISVHDPNLFTKIDNAISSERSIYKSYQS